MGNICEPKQNQNNIKLPPKLDIIDIQTQFLYSSNILEQKKPTLNDFQIIKVIGRGSYGKVFLVFKKDSKKYYAMKTLKKFEINQDLKKHILSERKILGLVNHPFITSLQYALQTKTKLYFFTEFMRGGEIFFHLHKFKKFTEDKSRFYIAQIILAIEYLHKQNIIYRDLKPENILMDENGYIKITDFGLSKIINEEQPTTLCGTPEYIAPEVISSGIYSLSADWYAVGAVLYEMLVGSPPFYSSNKNLMYQCNLKRIQLKISGDPTYPNELSKEAINLLQKLMNKVPEERPKSEVIKTHEFFQKLNWEKLIQMKIDAPLIPIIQGSMDLQNFDKRFTEEPLADSPIKGVINQTCNNYEKFTFEMPIDGNVKT